MGSFAFQLGGFLAKTLIVGGGVIGLLSAQLLAAEGDEVLLVERQQLGAESSWAGAGLFLCSIRGVTAQPSVLWPIGRKLFIRHGVSS